jgi:hypothetical protein
MFYNGALMSCDEFDDVSCCAAMFHDVVVMKAAMGSDVGAAVKER